VTGPLFVKLEVTWVDNPKVIAAGMAGKGLHAAAMCLSKRLETDGWIDRALLHREGADDALIDQCIELGLLEVDGRRVRPFGWLDRNPSQGAIDAKREAKAEAGRKGNHTKWKHPGEFADCDVCQATRTSDRTRSHTDPKSSPDTETETETETTTPTKSQDYSQPDAEPSPPVVDEQSIRRTAALVGRTVADHSGAANPGAYAATVTAAILTGDDPTDRDRITAALAVGGTPEMIAAGWVPDPLATVLGPIGGRRNDTTPTRPAVAAFDPARHEAEAEAQRRQLDALEAHQ
jgi:hypothetical protein